MFSYLNQIVNLVEDRVIVTLFHLRLLSALSLRLRISRDDALLVVRLVELLHQGILNLICSEASFPAVLTVFLDRDVVVI